MAEPPVAGTAPRAVVQAAYAHVSALFGDFAARSGETEGAVAVAGRRAAPTKKVQEGW